MLMKTDHLSKIPQHFNETEAAKLIGLSVKTLRRWRLEHVGPPYLKYGEGKRGRVVYSEADLSKWLEAHRVESDS